VARICASTGADLHACVIAALMAQSGPMQIGGATDLEFLLQTDAAKFSGHTKPGHSALLLMKDIPCFGHPLYARDPRADLLLELTRACALLTNTVGRTAGWVAHAVEQRLAGAMLRPRAQYMGKQHPRTGF
jgi:citrate synthase